MADKPAALTVDGGAAEPAASALNTATISTTTTTTKQPSTVTQEEQQQAQPPPNPKPSALLLLALCAATFLAALDTTIITTALPSIAADFRASQAIYTWVGSAYLVPYAVATPLWAKSSDVFGRKAVLLLANLVFFAGSLVCARASSPAMLIAARAVQGAAGGGLVVLVNIIIGDLFSQRERGKFFGLIGACWAVAGSLGPIIGGALAARVSWRWCFYINLPCDGLAFLAIAFFLHVHNPRTPLKQGLLAIDWAGAVLLAAAAVLLLVGLQLGSVSSTWASAQVIVPIACSPLALGLFILVERYVARHPLMSAAYMRKGDVLAILGVSATHGLALMGTTYFLPYYFQTILRATPLQSALWFLPTAATLSILSIPAGLLVAKTGRFLELVVAGMALATLGAGLLVLLPPARDWARIVPIQIVAALGLGCNLQAPMLAVQTRVRPADSAAATACASLMRNLFAAVGVVLAGVITSAKFRALSGQARDAGIPDAILEQIADAPSASADAVQSLDAAQQELVRRLLNEALGGVWVFFTAVLALGLLCSLRIGHVVLAEKHTEHKTGLQTEEENWRRGKRRRGGDREGSVDDGEK